ncbi:UDP-galactopyranose mutase [Desulfosporosinus sp. HMP52]|nr:UDP-galactopyranose mutase [Desulfosporosinus sp. HMP52]
MDTKYDYLIVGAGLFGSIFAHEASKRGKSCLVIDKRNHIGGNVFTKEIEGINVHQYGAHIFHTSNKQVWDYMNGFSEFNRYTNSPLASYQNELYNLPFNMNTFHKMWGVRTPAEAKAIIAKQVMEAGIKLPRNLEEQAISLVGRDIYEKLVKGYTEKQWGMRATELPAFIIKRLPVRFTFDNNYFDDAYQGIPIGGYTKIVEKLLENIEVNLNTDFFANRRELEKISPKILFTGMIDEFYQYRHGELEYRSLKFEQELLNLENYQGNAVVNYTEFEVPYTRIIEHKHFEYGTQPKTVITKEYALTMNKGDEPYYPVNNLKNEAIYAKYKELAQQEARTIFGGRLAEYKYYDMHHIVERALKVVEEEMQV